MVTSALETWIQQAQNLPGGFQGLNFTMPSTPGSELEIQDRRAHIQDIPGIGTFSIAGFEDAFWSMLDSGMSAQDAVSAVSQASQSGVAPTGLEGMFGSSPVSFSGLGMGAAGDQMFMGGGGQSGSPAAFGFPMFAQMMDLILRANAERRASIDQTLSTVQLLTELSRVSPTRAAEMATALGLPGMEPNLEWVNAFGGPQGTNVRGRVGTQDLMLPRAFSGQQLSFLAQNPTAASQIGDVADWMGTPDIFNTSSASLLPTSNALLSLAG